jgi:hypothetical protein
MVRGSSRSIVGALGVFVLSGCGVTTSTPVELEPRPAATAESDPTTDVVDSSTAPDAQQPTPASSIVDESGADASSVATDTAATSSVAPTVAVIAPTVIDDQATGLSFRGVFAETPSGADANLVPVVPGPVGGAFVSIEAGQISLSLREGTCSVVEGVTHVAVGAPVGEGPGALLTFTGPEGSDAHLSWQAMGPDSAVESDHGENGPSVAITFDDASAMSGSLSVWINVRLNTTKTPIYEQFTGEFACSPAPFLVFGDHPLSLRRARCDLDRALIAAGGTNDAGLLVFDAATLAAVGQFRGALTWRVAGQVFETVWLAGVIGSDARSANFIGAAVGADGVEFGVSGSYHCND